MVALDGAAPLSDEDALALVDSDAPAADLLAAARVVRDRAFGRVVTFSPKAFLPLTNLCRNRCDYCSFRRSPGDDGEWTMRPVEVEAWLDRALAQGCSEALFCLGDTPEAAFSAYRRTLVEIGRSSTVDYLHWSAARALDRGILPHTNAGILDAEEMARLREVNVSLGLMLENVSPRLCEPGMPHHKAPDKRPEKRLRMIEEAGRLRIPFTTGILVGIGETRRERVESLLAIRRLHRAHGHIQEVIVQNFRAVAGVPMSAAPEPDEAAITDAIALARLILDEDVSLQAPPNLNPSSTEALLSAGLNDFGGISPVTPDYINPRHPWPHLDQLADSCAQAGFELRPRAPIYDRYVTAEWLDSRLHPVTRETVERLAAVKRPGQLAAAAVAVEVAVAVERKPAAATATREA
ncbi:MAG: 7,8-didemethyl-8-hydroxy-5-deazariboflavin synthase, CofG subunit [Myxococcales bacterium]|nr:7,8-didemethyl-8-hydroxy-5-deazariboflavin synthase, CofG subunit [Myxococcales bacterium]